MEVITLNEDAMTLYQSLVDDWYECNELDEFDSDAWTVPDKMLFRHDQPTMPVDQRCHV
jgi:hypothetical protein